jgi:hypothetical protein
MFILALDVGGNIRNVKKVITKPVQGSIFRSEKNIYSPPPSENDIFPPLATRHFSTPIVACLP